MKRIVLPLVFLTLTGIFTSACQIKPNDPPLRDRLQTLNADLKIGDAGDDVRTVHEYLGTFGYYPNANLAARFPAWRPTIGNEPEDPTVFDTQTADAVRQLQTNYGLSPTGIVDAPTRAAMATPRCGVPDGIARLDSSDKFSLGTLRVQNQTLVGSVSSDTSNVTLDDVLAIGRAAGIVWMGPTFLQISMQAAGSSGTGGMGVRTFIEVGFGGVGGPGDQLAQTYMQGTTEVMRFSNAETWSVTADVPPNAVDLDSVFIHQLGHALGLGHSGFSNAVMYPTLGHGVQKRSLDIDDALGVRTLLYGSFFSFFGPDGPGAAQDIGMGADGSLWAIGTSPQTGGFRIYRMASPGVWTVDSNGASGAVRIAVAPDGSPWVVNNAGNVYHKTSNSPSSGVWQFFPGIAASDIGVSAGGVWAISKTPAPGGFLIYQLVGQQWVLDSNGASSAIRIAVDDSGIPWVVNSAGGVYRKMNGSWQLLPGPVNALDVAVPPGTINGAHAFVVRGSQGGEFLSLWNQQPAVAGPTGQNAPAVVQWVDTPGSFGTPGASTAVTAGPGGKVWLADGAGFLAASVP